MIHTKIYPGSHTYFLKCMFFMHTVCIFDFLAKNQIYSLALTIQVKEFHAHASEALQLTGNYKHCGKE